MKTKGYDVLLAVLLLLAAALLWLLVRPGGSGGWVVVTQRGEEVARYALSEQVRVSFGSGEAYNVLEIKNGAASVTQANCGDHTCIRTGEISLAGETIICLPHELVIQVIGGEQSGFDAVTR